MANTQVRIVTKRDTADLKLPYSRCIVVENAIKVAASELMGQVVEDLHMLSNGQIYAMPAPNRRKKVGKAFVLENASQRYVYLRSA